MHREFLNLVIKILVSGVITTIFSLIAVKYFYFVFSSIVLYLLYRVCIEESAKLIAATSINIDIRLVSLNFGIIEFLLKTIMFDSQAPVLLSIVVFAHLLFVLPYSKISTKLAFPAAILLHLIWNIAAVSIFTPIL